MLVPPLKLSLIKTMRRLSLPPARSSSLALLPKAKNCLNARDVDLATAIFRNRVIHPEQYDDDEQDRRRARRATIPSRTKRTGGNGIEKQRAGTGVALSVCFLAITTVEETERLIHEVITLIHQVLETHYDTVTRKPKRGAYGEYLKRSEEQHLKPVSQRTFYLEAQRHKAIYEQTLAREGTRAAYPFKDYFDEPEKTISRHGSYAWAMAHWITRN